MDYLKKCQIFEVAASVFSTSGRTGIEAWVRGFEGSKEEKDYVSRIYNTLLDNSRDSGRVLCLHDSRITRGLGLEGGAKLRILS